MEDKRIVLITGCGKGGIGHEYCKAFADHNCHVIATDVPDRIADLSGLLSSAADNIEALPLDVSSDESVLAAVSYIMATHGRIDVVVNNAGIGSVGPLAELALDSIRRAWEINALGALRVVQAVVPHMARPRGGGRVVNVGSIVGTAPTPWAGSYCASKAYVHAMSDALRVELRPFGIHVVKVMPGAIKSNFGSSTARALCKQEWKMYGRFERSIAERAGASQTAKATDAAVFARYVAKRVLSPRPPREVVYGHMTALFAALAWSPPWVRDCFFSKHFGLDKKM
ncbi:(+)-neomenthol dehydrogenase [Acorus calamus]|uniref:(+)-neomenthol dehydrogenase n=1 Tax=Acorus calamus TaxID=4465 RepID=A0AAV9CV16_ACOCL|nr:(+)-neomenthol dehydrogenase [Acorus calamus]